MTVLQSILMGAVQGITEFLPISSSAHLIAIPWFFEMSQEGINPLTYDIILHFGTLFAVLLIYGKRFARVVVEGLIDFRGGRGADSMLFKLVIATIPAVIAGFLGKDIIESYLRAPFVAAFMLSLVSILMIVSERINIDRSDLTTPIAIAIGVAQAIALVPGTSRSGITITMALLLGLKKSEAVDFSFMLSIPIILGVSLSEMRHVQFQGEGTALYVCGMLSAFVFGAVSLKFLIGYLKKHTLDLFAYYRIALALLILIFSFVSRV
ncbi:MAG: undecaprenyl-diphosphate phosphatase [Syntrophorhabdaceae bacterium]|nr:undecaprenyl-diphosphate phosphatase [Syntrophorhabdaceae bacterium]